MPPTTENALDDIAFMKALAVEGGRPSPMPGGLLAFIGGLFTMASLIHWAVQNRFLPFGYVVSSYAWMGAALIGAASMIIAFARRRAANPRGAGARAARMGMGIAIYVLLFVFGYGFWKLQNPAVMELFSATVFAIYGAYWSVAAAVTETRWFRWVAGISYLLAILLALMLTTPHIYLVSGLGIFAVACVPGLMLLASARAART